MLELSRQQILAHRRRVTNLGARREHSADSLRRAAAAGLQDSMPRAALLALHARVAGIRSTAWEEPPLIQVWGPRYSAFVIAEDDLALFTLGRLPDTAEARKRAEAVAERLEAALGDERMDVRDAARLVGLHPNALRYGAPTGRFLIHWDGARQPLIWRVPAPLVDPSAARLSLARRFLHAFAPARAESFATWAGIRPPGARAAFEALADELVPVRTPIGDRWILHAHAEDFRSAEDAPATRLLPSGDPYYLLWGDDRSLLVPDSTKRDRLWTSRVWPGAVLHDGEIVGTWRRSGHNVTIQPWQSLRDSDRAAICAEVESLPLPGVTHPVVVTWERAAD